MPLTINQIYGQYLSEELPYDGDWASLVLSLAAEVGLCEYYDLVRVPTSLSRRVEDSELIALRAANLQDPCVTLYAAAALRVCPYQDQASQHDAVRNALAEYEQLKGPVTIPVEVQERVTALVKDNPSLMARLSIPVLNKISVYLNSLLLRDITEQERDLLIFHKLSQIVYKPDSSPPPFKVGKLPQLATEIFNEIDPVGNLYQTKRGLKIYRSILNWTKNGVSRADMVSRALEIMNASGE